MQDAGVETQWELAHGNIVRRLTERARFADLLVVGKDDSENPSFIEPYLLSQNVVMQSSAPVLVLPMDRIPSSIGHNIVIAWDGSYEVARTVRDSLPLLQQEGRVLILTIDPNEEEHRRIGIDAPAMAAHLGRHGIEAETLEALSERKTVTEVLLACVADVGADLLLTGAFGHSRLKEFLLGGVTYDLLLKLPVPVLMSH